ncbi:MAG TPA: MFS transporter, partial [Chloroflexota bacterium]|nr:MFS transporter [Chloroflexota bacterium]
MAQERAVIRAGAVVGLAVIGDSLLYAVLPSRYAEFGVPAHLLGVLLGANRLVRIVFNTLAGRLYARAGRAWPFFLGSVLATGTTALMAFLPGFWLLLGIRVVWG